MKVRIVGTDSRIVQSRQLRTNVEAAKLKNTRTLGKQQLKGLKEEPRNEGPKERIVLSRRSEQAAPPEKAEKSESKEKAPSLAELESSFLNSVSENMSPDDTSKLARRAQSSMQRMKDGGGKPKLESVLAALTYNHALGRAKSEYPGMTLKQLRAVSKEDREARGLVSLVETSSQYLRETKRLQAQPQEALPPDALEQAQARAERMAAIREMAKANLQMQQENRETFAKIHALDSSTSQDILDMMNKSFFRQHNSLQEHHKQYVYLLTEVWPKA